MTDLNRQFLERVVVWPGAKEAPGWINLHTHLKNTDPKKNGGKPFVIGWPFKTVDDFINRATWLETTDSYFDVWYCTSQQREAGTNTKGKIKAVRLSRNATWLKALWFDIDIKPDDQTGKHYTSLKQALDALRAFRHKVGLPGPSALVDSGGGLHVYWISDQPLDPAAWLPYADGLKALALTEGLLCDTGLTTDNVRLLRVPGTLNHKYDPPRRVALLGGVLGRDYNFEKELSFLTGLTSSRTKGAGINAGYNSQNNVSNLTEPGANFDAPDPAFAALSADDNAVAAGIEATGPKLVNPAPIFAKCGFLREAFKTGGKDYDQPLWNLSVLCTVFMENGNAFAHEISKGHPGYSPADTQALYDRKVADRSDRGIGYPSCSAIEGSGCKACATCPLKPQGKSPLNIRPAVTATVRVTPQTAAGTSLALPDPYDVDSDGIICEIQQKREKNGDLSEVWLKLFKCRIDTAWATKNPDAINLHFSTDGPNWDWATVKMEEWSGPGYERNIAKKRIKYAPDGKLRLENFFMSFLEEMHKHQARENVPFGWYRSQGAHAGFAAGGIMYDFDGRASPTGIGDRELRDRFSPTGTDDCWYVAMSYITRQKRPELEAGVAVSFAAPLMEITGTTGAMVSIAGEPGAGKSYALEVGAAVWGHPKKTKEGANSTPKSVVNRMGQTRNLPCYWDEIIDAAMQKKVLGALMETTQGVEGSRLKSDITHQLRGTWSTILGITTNRWFRDFVVREQRDHGAALTRCLEYWVKCNPENAVGQVDTSDSDQALAELCHNYGGVGTEYTKLITTNYEAVVKLVNSNLKLFNDTLKPDKADRMWIGLMAAWLSGAQLANMMPRPAGFDIPALYDFIVATYHDNKDFRAKSNTSPSAVEYAGDFLNQYLKERQLETIWTTGAPGGAGGRSHIAYDILNPNTPRTKSFNIRCDRMTKQIWISTSNFRNWCDNAPPELGRSYRAIITSMRENYTITDDKRVLAGGTPYKTTQERVFVIDCAGRPDLEAIVGGPATVDNSALGASTGPGTTPTEIPDDKAA
jgi:hypothetical protein